MQHKNCTPLFDLVPRCQVSRCPALRYGLALSSLAMSVLAISVAPIQSLFMLQIYKTISPLKWYQRDRTSTNVLWIRNWQTLLQMCETDYAAYALTRWQHFSARNNATAAIFKLWRHITNPTSSVDAYLLEVSDDVAMHYAR